MFKVPACLVFIMVMLVSCADRYKPYRSNYQFKSNQGNPDYSSLDYWAAHPWKWDPSDSVPAQIHDDYRDSTVDVFFLHPTTHTKKRRSRELNAAIDDDYINAKTDYSTILYQASVFNKEARVFAPRYRQAHISNFFHLGDEEAKQAFNTAYEDLRNAFQYYLAHWNNGRPFIIASHSQGSLLAERLLKEFIDGKPLHNKMVMAYIIGWPVPPGYFDNLKMCKDSFQTGCICSWRTVRNGFIPKYVRIHPAESYVTNPLTWTTGTEYASHELNKGSVLINFEKVYPHTTDARVGNGLLNVKKPKFPWSFFYFKRNYHIGDINLFYVNIREDVHRRIGYFWKK